jgi:hypothetical protein
MRSVRRASGLVQTPQHLPIESGSLDGDAAHEPYTDRGSEDDDRRSLLKGMAQFRVLNTCLYQGFRADLADRDETEIR